MGMSGSWKIAVRSFAVRVSLRYWSGGMPASAQRLVAVLRRKAPVAMRIAEFWTGSSSLR